MVDRLVLHLWDKGLGDLNRLRARRGLPPLRAVWDQLHHLDRVLVLTSPSFDIVGAPPPNVVYAGPQLDDPEWSAVEWAPPPGDGPLVLASLSSGFQDQAATLGRVVEALRALPMRAVVTTGPAMDPAGLGPGPEHVRVVRSAPHQRVLAHAAAVVTHAGHGTLLKALAAGVPAVCLPMGRDQADNAARLVRLGAGLRLKPGARAAAIRGAVRRVIDEPAFAERAGAFAERLHGEAGDPPIAVAELEALVAGGRPPAAEPVAVPSPA